MKRLTFLLLLLLAGLCPAQTVTLPAEVKVDPGTFAIVPAKTDCAALRWYSLDQGLSMIPPELLKDTKTAIVMAGKTGRYRLLAYGALKDQASPPSICVVIVGEAPVPPIPPNPPDPPVPPGPAPIPVKEGLAVLIVYGPEGGMAPEQNSILYAKEVRDYLRQKCPPDPGAPAARLYRIWRDGSDISGTSQLWKDAMARKRASLPWIIVSTPSGGYEGPLPKDVKATMELLKKYGG